MIGFIDEFDRPIIKRQWIAFFLFLIIFVFLALIWIFIFFTHQHNIFAVPAMPLRAQHWFACNATMLHALHESDPGSEFRYLQTFSEPLLLMTGYQLDAWVPPFAALKDSMYCTIPHGRVVLSQNVKWAFKALSAWSFGVAVLFCVRNFYLSSAIYLLGRCAVCTMRSWLIQATTA